MASAWRQHLENFLKTLEIECESVIDIGGSQLPVSSRLKKFIVKDYKIIDLPDPHETKRKADYSLDIQDTFAILGLKRAGLKEANVVFCLEVSEYWVNPVSALKSIKELMRKGGVLFISFHWTYPVHKPTGKDYLRYSVDGAKELLKYVGLKVEEVYPHRIDSDEYFNFIEKFRYKADYNNKNGDVGGFIIKAKKII